VQKQIHQVHFEDFSGTQFERLCFAYFVRKHVSDDVEWYGQLGSDRGRDIVIKSAKSPPIIVQCANHKKLAFAKVQKDLKKLSKGPLGTSAVLQVVAGGGVSGKMKDKVAIEATRIGFASSKVWSGAEFEELLRRDAPELLKRFTEGEPFPELPAELKAFSVGSSVLTDQQIVDGIIAGFDRPALRTPFHHESSIPRFEKALVELIELVNTGKTPQGPTIPAKKAVRDKTIREQLDLLVNDLVQLRASYDQLKRDGDIRPCGCNDPDCPVFMVTDRAILQMDQIRTAILKRARHLSQEVPDALYAIH
jgi:hypothetical protein